MIATSKKKFAKFTDSNGYCWKDGLWFKAPESRTLEPPYDQKFSEAASKVNARAVMVGFDHERNTKNNRFVCYLLLNTSERLFAEHLFDYVCGLEWRGDIYKRAKLCSLYVRSIHKPNFNLVKSCYFGDHSAKFTGLIK